MSDVILTLSDASLGLGHPVPAAFTLRRAGRAVVVDRDGLVGLVNVTKLGFYTLPGGGIDEGEDLLAGLAREVVEEIGCGIGNVRKLGVVEEFRHLEACHQLNHGFLADLAGEKGTPRLDDRELAEGYETAWLDLDEAIAAIERQDYQGRYGGYYLRPRDLALLRTAREALR